MVSCRVGLDGHIIASRFDGFDRQQSMVGAMARRLAGQTQTEFNRPQKQNNPYPFALKLLQDFHHSEVDADKTKELFALFSMDKSIIVEPAQEYTVALGLDKS
jgi:hypothetical protein